MTEDNVDFERVCAAIADAMGEGWTSSMQHAHGNHLVGPDDAHIFMRLGTYGAEAKRIKLDVTFNDIANYNSYTHGDDRGTERATMGVSVDRDPAAIAKEIRRRILDSVVKDRAIVRENVAARLQREDDAAAVAADLVQRIGNGAYVRNGDEVNPGMNNPWHGDLTVNYNATSVKVNLSGVSIETARKIADLLGKED